MVAKLCPSWLLKFAGWRTVGDIPNISQAVVLALPHTSNIDGIYAIPSLFALDLKINIMGKHTLFKVPVLAQLLRWIGIIPIDRGNKGSVLQTSIDKFKSGEPLFLGLSPEGTRKYTENWKTGFYYLALGLVSRFCLLPWTIKLKKCVSYHWCIQPETLMLICQRSTLNIAVCYHVILSVYRNRYRMLMTQVVMTWMLTI